ncbi:MAG: amidohydrolase [Spirochaetae bacterium HGW-Spirochaetae-1]|nr:MAG: amidohydrolase [Spirochaetae bacterium HGW-Spirochaetae-1]
MTITYICAYIVTNIRYETMIIDAHAHIFTPVMVQNRDNYFSDPNFALLYRNPSARMVTHQGLLDTMDSDGIDHSIAVGFPWHDSRYCREQNEYFADVHQLSGSRISAFGSVPLEQDANPGAWVREIKDMGLAGIGETGFYEGGMTPKSRKYLGKVMEAAAVHELPLCLHVNEPVGHRYAGKYEPDLAGLFDLVADYKDAVIIFAHWGGGLIFYELMPEVRELFRNFYYDTAASPFLYDNSIYSAALNIAGADKILFGTDYPLLKAGRYLDPIRETVPAEEDRNKILGDNARRILMLPGA